TVDPAVSGNGGHDATIRAARLIRNDFACDCPEGYGVLQEYNQRCVPPWSESELRHKWADAAKGGDGYARGCKLKRPHPAAPAAGFVWRPMTSADFAKADFRPQWLVRNVLVRGQPAIIGGAVKTLKTGLGVDLAIALASGGKFLGAERFAAERVRTAILSGES